MRRIIIAFAVVVTVTACLITVNQLCKKSKSVPYLGIPCVEARLTDDKYVITISSVDDKNKTVIFSQDRTAIKTTRICLLQEDLFQGLVGTKMTVVEERCGKPHADIGSGLYIPAYVTENAYLISFQVDGNGIIQKVYKLDLLSSSEWKYSAGSTMKTGD